MSFFYIHIFSSSIFCYTVFLWKIKDSPLKRLIILWCNVSLTVWMGWSKWLQIKSSRTLNILCTVSVLGLESGYTGKYSTSPRKIQGGKQEGFSKGSGYISPYILTQVIIQTLSISKNYTYNIVLPGKGRPRSKKSA